MNFKAVLSFCILTIFIPLCFCDDFLLDGLTGYFNSITWAAAGDSGRMDLPEPYPVPASDADIISAYADTNNDESVFPEVEGIGVLDYRGIENGLLVFFKQFSSSICKKKLEPKLCVNEKPFLPHLFAFRFEKLPNIKNAFFSRPQFNGSKAISKFHCAYENEGKSGYFIVEAAAVLKDGKWLTDSFDFIGKNNADTAE